MDTLVAAVICSLSLIIGIIAIYENELFSTSKKCLFAILAAVIVFEICSDTFLIIINGKKLLPNDVYKLIKIMEFATVPLIPTLFSKIITHRHFWKKIRKVFWSITTVNLVFQITSFVIPLMFEYKDTVYNRTQYTYIYVGLISVTATLFLVCASKTFVQSSKISCTLVCTVVLVIVGMLLRAFNIDSNADWMCITSAYFIFLFYFSSTYLKVDPLTLLLNRKAFDNRIEKVSYDTAIIVIDANNFKNINDEYGHIAGDKALVKIAKVIYTTFGRYGYCYRIGGDEFCVLFKKNALPRLIEETENFDSYNTIKKLLAKLDEQMELEIQKYPMLVDGVACGFGIYRSPGYTDEPDTYKTIEEVFKIADDRMYEDKERKKTAKSDE